VKTPLPPVLRRFWILMTALTVISAIYTAITAYLWKLPMPYGLPLLWYDAIGGDFNVFGPGFQHFGTPQFWSSFDYAFTYPAPLGVVFAMFFRLSHPIRVYESILCIALAVGAWSFVRELTRRQIAPALALSFTLTTLTMTWPLIFQLDTANIEGLVVIVLAAGLIALLKDRWWLGCALIGIAGAMKIFPFVLLALALSKRRYTEFAGGIAIAAVVMIASLAILGPSVVDAQRHINVGFALVRELYFFSMSRLAPAFDHSLWMPVRFAAVFTDRMLHPLPLAEQAARTRLVLERSLDIYMLTTAALGTILFFTKIRTMPLLNQILALTVCAVLLPPLSLEYTLLHLLLPFALLCTYAVDMASRGERTKGLESGFLCLAVIFNCDAFLNHRYLFAAEARLVALVALLIVVLTHRFEWPVREARA
jgi:hypothetical protein